jgi:hypothetical protein
MKAKKSSTGIGAVIKRLLAGFMIVTGCLFSVIVFFLIIVAVLQGKPVSVTLPFLGNSVTIGPSGQEEIVRLGKDAAGAGYVSRAEHERILQHNQGLLDENKKLSHEIEQLAKNSWYSYSIVAERMASGLVINTALPVTDEDTRKLYKCVQCLLMVLGHYDDKIDGDQGKTNAAVLKFQADNKLKKIDGVIGKATWSCMVNGLKEVSQNAEFHQP